MDSRIHAAARLMETKAMIPLFVIRGLGFRGTCSMTAIYRQKPL